MSNLEHIESKPADMNTLNSTYKAGNTTYVVNSHFAGKEKIGNLVFDILRKKSSVQSAVILERCEKTFSSEESAQKYIDGKIKAYDYLFTEISPVIPDVDKSHFCVNGVLLPGYTTVSMQKEKEKKASIRKQLNELKADKPPEQLKTRTKEVSR